MANRSFDFKKFSIIQDRCAMKVGTDGVLLGAWVAIQPNIDNNNQALAEKREIKLLDIGTGTGLIALMAAQRLSEMNVLFSIDAIEINNEAAEQAKENIINSSWSDNISIIPLSLAAFDQQEISASKQYDYIVSNPPFYNATLKPEDKGRAIARHKDSLPLKEITDFAEKHLAKDGELSLIFPTDYDTEVMTAATLSNLRPIILCDVITKKGKPCKRRMATFARSTHMQKEIVCQSLSIRDENSNYTKEYIELVDKYYLSLT